VAGGVLWCELLDRPTAPKAGDSVVSERGMVPDRLRRETSITATKNTTRVRKVVHLIKATG
jgi:hypothetical protein